MKKLFTFLFFLFFQNILTAQPSPFIHVDQFGYFPNAEKVAVLSDPQEGFNAFESYSPPNEMQVRRASDDVSVFSGNINAFDGGNTDFISGDRGWWFDFSSLMEPGEYYVYDAENDFRSAKFHIAENVYLEVMKAAGRMFFYNRCNFPKEAPYADENWTDGQNFLNPGQDANTRYIYDPTNAALEKDLSGGWFDAGDYNKYVTFTEGTLHDLLWAIEENESAFGDDWNIPESGNGIPDMMDEIKWELDWLLKMVNPDGSAIIKMGSQNHSENSSSPPSINMDGRYYGPTCTSASVTIASVFAHAAIVLKNYEGMEGYAAILEDNAIKAYEYVVPFFENNNLEEDCDDGSIVSGDADRDVAEQTESLIAAAVYLFELTGDETYHNFIKDNYAQTETMISGYWGADAVIIQDALIRYSGFDNGEENIKNEIAQSATTEVNNNWNGFFGWSENDLYRSYMPDWSYFWGCNRVRAGYGSLNMSMAQNNFSNDIPGLERKAAEHLHYFHGVNPQGMVMLSNMYEYGAENSANEIYHAWFNDGTEYDNALTSPKGPAPGYVVGGPNPYFSYPDLSPPANQPHSKSYLDFNTGWPESSWEITEPAIYYQAAYIRFLANYVEAEMISSVKEKELFSEINIYPNPASEIIFPSVDYGAYSAEIMDSFGRTVKSVEWSNGNSIDVRGLPSGLYFLKLKPENGGGLFLGKWIND